MENEVKEVVYIGISIALFSLVVICALVFTKASYRSISIKSNTDSIKANMQERLDIYKYDTYGNRKLSKDDIVDLMISSSGTYTFILMNGAFYADSDDSKVDKMLNDFISITNIRYKWVSSISIEHIEGLPYPNVSTFGEDKISKTKESWSYDTLYSILTGAFGSNIKYYKTWVYNKDSGDYIFIIVGV